MSEILVEHNVGAAMRDGTVLRANVYRPTHGGPFPVLLSRQPYNKDANINLVYFDPLVVAASGYIVVMQDVRGRYASDGQFSPGEQEFEDGYDSVQWAAGLPGSSGRVGMWGRSYHAETQWRAAACQPPALESLALGVSPGFPANQAEYRRGGVPETFRLLWPQLQIGLDRLVRHYRADPDQLARAVDEYVATSNRLATGELLGRLPVRELATEPGSLMGEVIAALRAPLAAPAEPGAWPSAMYERVRADTFHIGGWYDIFLPSTLGHYRRMAAAAETSGRRLPHLLIGPWTHSAFLASAGQVDFGLGASGAFLDGRGNLNAEHVRWFDATLKGRQAALADTPPPIYAPGPFDQRPIEARPDVLSYTSQPLGQPCTVLGDISVTLYAASSASDTDFVARLVDVYPDGQAINVADGIIRASARESYPRPGVARAVVPSPIEPERAYAYTIDLWASAITLLPGHRLRVDITSSSHPRWLRNLNTGHSAFDSAETAVARQRIFHDPQRPSRLALTVLEHG